MPSLLRSMIAIIVGFMVMMLAVIALALVMVKTMGVSSGHPTAARLTYNALASFFAALVGGFVTGTIAPERQVRHGYLLAMVMLMMAALSYLHYTGGQPAWYQAMMVVVPSLFAVLGAKVATTAHLASEKAKISSQTKPLVKTRARR
jgi:peptidoglycan/LPS O-acetylase OafA/YrhL